jgi:hypothetical protein
LIRNRKSRVSGLFTEFGGEEGDADYVCAFDIVDKKVARKKKLVTDLDDGEDNEDDDVSIPPSHLD